MSANRKPLKRSIIIGCTVFIVLLCLILSVLTYTTYTRSLYRSYEARMTDIIEYVESHIDVDDLAQCIDTGVESEKFKEMMTFMDGIMEDFDVHYLYIVKPVEYEDSYVMMNIFSADTAQGRLEDPDGYYLGMLLHDDYELKDVLLYKEAMEKDGIVFFKNVSIWGYDYTGLLTLVDSKGDRVAALGVDFDVYELQRSIRAFTIVNVALIVILGCLFMGMFLLWMNRNVSGPITRLERSVVAFASSAHDQKDPEKLKYDDPDIHTQNEVESLSNAMSQMSLDMKKYVRNILDAEGVVEDMKTKVNQMDMVVYQDALTHVKNKAWYDMTEERVNGDIQAGTARFGILMADLNNLKKINDNYGHDHGNDYITGACHHICVTYQHSPVVRVGGDEFVVILENSDYDHREELLAEIKEVFNKACSDAWKDPWEKYSCAFGMAVYEQGKDRTMEDVFKRADSIMYRDKQNSKMARQS